MCIQMFFKGRLVFVAFLTIVTNKGQGLMHIFNMFFQCCMSEKVKGTSLHCAMVGQFILFQCLFLSNNLKLGNYILNSGGINYSWMNMRQLHILFNSAKTWHVIVCWFLCFPPNLPELNLKLFWTSEQNNFRFSSGKFGEKHRNQQRITCQVLAELNKIWRCLH